MIKSKILIPLILLLGFVNQIKSQDYLDFQTWAEYDISSNTLDFLPTPIITYYSSIQDVYFSHTNTEGVLLYTGYLYWNLTIFPGEPAVSDFLVYVDSATKTVRLTTHNYDDSLYSKYAVLYDYNQMVGDTLHSDIMNPNNSGEYIITSIDTINYNGVDRRTFSVSGSSMKIIQGIGSTYGFITIDITPFEGGSTLDCVFIDGFHAYGTTCDMNVNERLKEVDMNVFPNPTNGIVSIELEDYILTRDNIVTIEVIDVLGNLIHTKLVSEQNISISLGDFPKGLYFIQLLNNDEIIDYQKVMLE